MDLHQGQTSWTIDTYGLCMNAKSFRAESRREGRDSRKGSLQRSAGVKKVAQQLRPSLMWCLRWTKEVATLRPFCWTERRGKLCVREHLDASSKGSSSPITLAWIEPLKED